MQVLILLLNKEIRSGVIMVTIAMDLNLIGINMVTIIKKIMMISLKFKKRNLTRKRNLLIRRRREDIIHKARLTMMILQIMLLLLSKNNQNRKKRKNKKLIF